MNKFVKGLIIGGAVGASAMAVRAYRRDEETGSARNDVVRGAAVGAAVGVALGLMTEAKPAVLKVSETIRITARGAKKSNKRIDRMRRSARKARRQFNRASRKFNVSDWSEIVAALTPLMSMVPMLNIKPKPRSSAARAATAVMNGPLGRVRVSTMNLGETLTNRAARVSTKMRHPRGHSHNGSH